MAYADSIRSASATMEQVATLIEGIYPADGWRSVTDSWSYASATTITVPTDATLTYSVGDRIKFTQSAAVKYFYVIGVAATVLTITGGSDYTNTNNAISSIYHSKQVIPVGWPDWFNYSPTLTGFSANPTNTVYRFKLTGRLCTVEVGQNTNGTSNATGFTITLPITAATVTNAQWGGAGLFAFDNGAILTSMCTIGIGSGVSAMTIFPGPNQGNWTNANGKRASFVTHYEI